LACAGSLQINNAPILVGTYQDPDSLNDKVIVAVAMFGGSTNINYEVMSDGKTLKLTFEWPGVMFNVADIFKGVIPTVPSFHPKYLSLSKELQGARDHIDEAPQATITIDLPISVINESDKMIKRKIDGTDGTKVFILEFTGFAREYSVKKSDKKLE
jgi:hypothetical protein